MSNCVGTNIIGRAVYINPNTKGTQSKINSANDWKDLNKKYISKNITARINNVLQEIQHDLNSKRKRLKKILEDEENSLFQELKQKQLQEQEEKLKIEKNVCLVEAKCIEEEQSEFLAKKQLEIDMTKCKEVRPVLALWREIELRKMQKEQMKEKEFIRSQEKLVDNMWHTIMMDDVKTRTKLEEKSIAEDLQKKATLRSFLDSQVQYLKEVKKLDISKERELELKQCNDTMKDIKEKQLKEIAQKNKAKLALKNNLIDQMEMAQIRKSQLDEEIRNLENSIINKSLIQHRDDNDKVLRNKELTRKEIDLYNKHLVMVKTQRKTQEEVEEMFINDTMKKQLSSNDVQRNILNTKQKQLLKSIIDERNKQLEEKRMETQNLEEQAKAEYNLRVRNNEKLKEIEHAEKKQIAEMQQTYKNFLEDQMKFLKTYNDGLTEKEKLEQHKQEMEEEKLREKCANLIKREICSEDIHPFMKKMMEEKLTDKNWYKYMPETKYFKY